MTDHLYWRGQQIAIIPGESLAYTLLRADPDNREYGRSGSGQPYGMFCGIGACQGCLVRIEGRGVVEACLTPARDGMRISGVEDFEREHPAADGHHDD